jgi:hypothetical protein
MNPTQQSPSSLLFFFYDQITLIKNQIIIRIETSPTTLDQQKHIAKYNWGMSKILYLIVKPFTSQPHTYHSGCYFSKSTF